MGAGTRGLAGRPLGLGPGRDRVGSSGRPESGQTSGRRLLAGDIPDPGASLTSEDWAGVCPGGAWACPAPSVACPGLLGPGPPGWLHPPLPHTSHVERPTGAKSGLALPGPDRLCQGVAPEEWAAEGGGWGQGVFCVGGAGRHWAGPSAGLRVPCVVWAPPGRWFVGFAPGTTPHPAGLPPAAPPCGSVRAPLRVVDYFYSPRRRLSRRRAVPGGTENAHLVTDERTYTERRP